MPSYSCRNMPTIKTFFDSDAFIRGLMGPFGCLSGDTEFMSPFGWKRMDSYEPGDEVLQWDRREGAFWTRPIAYVDEPCESLLRFDSGSLVMALSDEHRVPHFNYIGEFQVRTAAIRRAHRRRQ